VLFVDHRERERRGARSCTSVGADDEIDGARRERGARRLGVAARHRRGEQRDAQRRRLAAPRGEPAQRTLVLLRQQLGGCHHRDLMARLDGGERREERDRRLAAADVALQQPVHRMRLREVGLDLADDAALRAPVSWNGSASSAASRAGRSRARRPAPRSRAFAAQRESQFQQVQSSSRRWCASVVRCASASIRVRRRAVDLRQRSAAPGSLRARTSAAGSRPSTRSAYSRRRSARGGAARAGGTPSGALYSGTIWRSDATAATLRLARPARRRAPPLSGCIIREAVAAHVAGDEHRAALGEHGQHRVAAVEPLELDTAGLVRHQRVQNAPEAPAAPSRRGELRRAHLRREGGTATHFEIGDAHSAAPVVMRRQPNSRS
jgi:hypothetical protein